MVEPPLAFIIQKGTFKSWEFAISEFREMKMQPSLERAIRHKEILGA